MFVGQVSDTIMCLIFHLSHYNVPRPEWYDVRSSGYRSSSIVRNYRTANFTHTFYQVLRRTMCTGFPTVIVFISQSIQKLLSRRTDELAFEPCRQQPLTECLQRWCNRISHSTVTQAGFPLWLLTLYCLPMPSDTNLHRNKYL